MVAFLCGPQGCPNLEYKNKQGETALFVAAKHGRSSVVELLAQAGASLEVLLFP